jgi:hypothetical protein
MDARFASWRRRYPDGWDDATAAQVLAAARRLEVDVCDLAGIEPAAVDRLRWTARAFAEARA